MKYDRKDIRLLVVDDDQATRFTINAVLSKAGYLVNQAASVTEARQMLAGESADLVITDLRLGTESGMDVIAYVRDRCPETESILITAYGSIENAVEAIHAGAFDYLAKPFTNDQLVVKVQKAIEQKLMKRELSMLRQHIAMSYGFDNIVGISKPILQLKETAQRIATTDLTVLITGPSGTGKELFARAIHHHSNRRGQPFVAIDCSTIPEGLMETELFGHTKGSFTSATSSRKGLFEEADGGTIFLDEVSNMPASIQVKLLRFLQESEVRQIGSSVSRRLDVRIIAASNRDLGTMVGKDSFREDLFYRLNVIPLHLPSLTERAEDIEILTDYFLRKISSEMQTGDFSITRTAVDKLLRHKWPGNVRELENTLKRGIALCSDRRLDADDIIFINAEGSEPSAQSGARRSLTFKAGLLDSNQRTLIIKALNDNNWNYTRTARELGIGRTTLWRKMKKYDLRPETAVAATEE